MTVDPALLNAWTRLLDLCKLTKEEHVVLLTGAASSSLHIDAAQLALALRGASYLTLEPGAAPAVAVAGESTAHYGPSAIANNRLAQQTLKGADLIVDLMGMYRGAEQDEILAAGCRIILVKEPPDVMMRLMTNADDKRRVLAANSVLSRAHRMHVRSDAGTDLHVTLGQYPTLVQYGYADEPGRWDHCPSAFIARWPDEGSANGVVVLDSGDTILPFKDYVRTPIRLEIRDGFVRRIEGGLDARYLRDYIASFNDPDGYAVSHLGWGLHDRATWTALGMYDKRQTNAMDARSYYGNFMFSTGPNAEAGGSRHTPCHLDIPMSSCSIWVDDEPMVDHGNVVPANQRVAGFAGHTTEDLS
ncbi:2,5-dihydroxypyridine 5,6-dioxygenase [Pigmentiphaga litoralis]|uniref:2,5-dihydroxypyridine 5,6-dioxygenase n=1 Tax=Pigmentiphaga litoralis TaxID=516702 RepID=UPI001E54B925|nr:2,5-dihydroxypyridine 5,6-dioxygenase [Pigmentiphaga litoralis]